MLKNKSYSPKLLSERLTSWIGSTASLWAHTLFFILVFVLGFLGFDWEMLLIILTTAVSLEAIYLAIFIQMSVNRNTLSLEEVGENLEEIQTDVGDIAEDVEELAEDVEEIQTDFEEFQGDLEEIQSDMDAIQKDLDDIQDDVDDIAKGDKKVEKRDLAQKELLKNIHKNMNKLKSDLERLKNSNKKKNGLEKKVQPVSKQPVNKNKITKITPASLRLLSARKSKKRK